MGFRGMFKVAGQVEVEAAYAKVARVEGDGNSFRARFDVYMNKEAADAKASKLPGLSFDISYPYIAGLDPLEAPYLKLSQLQGKGEMPALTAILEEGQTARAVPDEFKEEAE